MQVKDNRKTVHLPTATHKNLKALASLKGQTVEAVVAQAVQEYIFNHLGETL